MINQKPSTRIQGDGVRTLQPGDVVLINPKIQGKDTGSVTAVTNSSDPMVQFVVSNEAAASTPSLIIYICGTDGQEALPVFPQTVVTLETDAPFKIKNPSGNASAVNCTVGRLLLRGGSGGGSSPAPAASQQSSTQSTAYSPPISGSAIGSHHIT